MSATPTRLEEVIQAIRIKLEKGFPNEAAVSQGAVLPILQACGWNTHDTDEVCPEYATQGNQRVDYALLRDGEPLIFIEVKHRLDNDRSLDKGIEQVLKYAFEGGATVAVLTDGDAWRFYWHAAPERRYADRLAQAIQLTRTEPTEAATILRKYLQKSPDISRNRLQKIIEEDFHLNKLHALLEEIFQNPTDELVELIERNAKQRDIDVGKEQIRAFLPQWLKKYKPSDSSPSSSAMLSNTTSTPHASGAPPLSSPPAGLGYYYKGTFYPASGKSDIYFQIIRRLIQDYPHFADRFSKESVGNNRYYLFRKSEKDQLPKEMRESYERNSKQYREIEQDWLVLADLNDENKRRKLRQAAEIVGLPFDDERGIKVIGF
jgi:type I site-specific restriction-modification system R (restriction) subunit